MSFDGFNFQEDRATYVKWQLLETNEGTTAAKDIQSSNISVNLRMYADADGALLLNTALTKIEISGGDYVDNSPAKSGVGGNVTPDFDGFVICRLVLIDAGTVNANTPSGYTEYVWMEGTALVASSVQPA